MFGNNNLIDLQYIAIQYKKYIDNTKKRRLMKPQYRQSNTINPKLIKQLQATLQKNIENRLSADHNIINKFINELSFLEYISEYTSLQIARYLLKWAKVIHIPPSRLVTQIRKPNNSLFILLSGGIGITNSSQNEFLNVKEQKQRMQVLIEKGFRYVKKYRFSSKIYNKQQDRFGKNTVFKRIQLTDYDFQQRFYSQKVVGFDDIFTGSQYTSTAITLKDSILLQIQTPYLMDAMSVYKNILLDQKMKVFITANSLFSEIPIQKMKVLMQKTQTKKLFKGDYIFKQGQKSQFFYILKQGQVTLKKTIKLFRQDPNRLYRNRKHMRSSTGQKPQNLVFSNFQSVYNYQAQQKIIDLGLISSITVFGEQQLYEKKDRQTSAKVTSIQAEIFVVSFKLLGAVLIERKDEKSKTITVDQFKRKLYQYFTNNKILYRQEKLSQILNTKNKLNMNYFFIQQQPQQAQQAIQVKNSNNARRSLRKFNRQIQSINHTHKYSSSFDNKNCQKSTFLTAFENPQTNEDFYQPTYNRFNFSKFKKSQKNQEDEINFNLSLKQNSIADLTHTVSQINRKVKEVCQRGNKLGVKKYSIDIKNPLFSLDYFRKVKNEALRIQKNNRKRMYESVSKINTNSNQFYKSRTGSTRPQSASTNFQTFRRLQQ